MPQKPYPRIMRSGTAGSTSWNTALTTNAAMPAQNLNTDNSTVIGLEAPHAQHHSGPHRCTSRSLLTVPWQLTMSQTAVVSDSLES